MVLLNTALSLLILLEEVIIVFLVLPWAPTKRIGQLFYFLRRWGFPGKLTFVVYVVFAIVIVLLNIVGLELYYLQVNEELQNTFNEFRSNLFTSLKLFIVVHRFLNLLSNEASLKSVCKSLQKKLKLQEGEAFEYKDGEFVEDDEEVQQLKEELEQVKQELLASRAVISRLQRQSDKSEHELKRLQESTQDSRKKEF